MLHSEVAGDGLIYTPRQKRNRNKARHYRSCIVLFPVALSLSFCSNYRNLVALQLITSVLRKKMRYLEGTAQFYRVLCTSIEYVLYAYRVAYHAM